MVLGVDSTTPIFADYADGYRTEQALSLPDAVKVWRQEAWRSDDFYAQVRLGDLYSQNQSFAPKESSKNPSFYDAVEAYVWYFMALRPDHNYSFNDNYNAYQNFSNVRSNALDSIRNVYNGLTFEQRLEARARILYILSSRGAEGFMTLGRLHGVGFSGGPPDPCLTDPTLCTRKILICTTSDYEKYLIPRIGWWVWTRFTRDPDDYPHRKVWRRIDRADVGNYDWFPESYCGWQPQPEPDYDANSGSYPSQGYSAPYPGNAGSYSGSYPGGGAVPLNGSAGNGLPVSPPNAAISADPRIALQTPPQISAGNTPPVALTTQDQPMAMGPPAGGYSGYGGGGYGYGGGYGGYYGAQGMGQSDLADVSVFLRNDAEALTYFQRADILGHPLADAYTRSLRDSINSYSADGRKIIADAEKRARYWMPRDEFYPGATAGGMPHTDESVASLEQRIALGRMRELPWSAISEALDFRRYTKHGRGCGPPPICYRKPIEQFQAAFGYEPTGILTPPQAVRLIQMAAVAGNGTAQDRLGIMYAKGIGVPQNFPRAEMWFLNAANQNNADAMFNLYVLYKVGPNGIEHNEDKASIYNVRAMAIGYNRLLCELQDLLRQAEDRRDHPDGLRRRS